MNDEIRPDNERDNRIIAMMNDASLCPVLEESKVGVSDYTKLPVSRMAALGTAFEPLATAVQTAVIGVGGSGLYYVDAAGKTMFQMNGTNYRFAENSRRHGRRRTGSDDTFCM